MNPAIHTQIDSDEKRRAISTETGIDCTDDPGITRQEMKNETDVNFILSRFGVNGLNQRPLVYGETDYTLDLQGAYFAIEAAQAAYSALPDEIKKKYRTWPDFLNAIERGEVKDLKPVEAAPISTEPVTPPQPEA